MRDRWIARGAMALLLASLGETAAQQSPTAATVPASLAQQGTATADQPIVLMRTAGQPDRQLKVMKLSKFTDGESVAEVQDVVTGQVFTLPGKVVALLPKAAITIAPPVSVSPPAPARPVAPPTPLSKPAPKPVQQPNEQPMPKVIHIPAPEPPPIPKIEKPGETKLPPALPVPVAAPEAASGSVVWRPRPNDRPALTPTPTVEPVKPDRWQPTKRMSLQSLSPVSRTIVRAMHHTGHDDDEAPAVRVLRPSVVEERTELVPVAYRSFESQIREETQGYVFDLASALRPSVREEAAICLAESRFGSRREVKTVLAKAALADPAPSVRAKCIELLMQLGYHEPEYLAFLQSHAIPGQAPTMVQAAAKDALVKLMPRGH